MAKAPAGQIFEQMQFDRDTAGTAVEDTIAALTKAVDDHKHLANNSNEDFIHEGITKLNETRELVPNAVEKLGVARGSAHTAAYDVPSVNAHKEEILAAIKQIATWEKQVLKLDTTVEKLVETLFAKLDSLSDASSHYAGYVNQMSKILSELTPDQPSVREALDGLHAKALKAVELRNANSLELAKSDAEGLNTKRFEDGLAKLTPIAKKAEEANAKVDLETRKSLMTDYGKARHRFEDLGKDVAHFKARKQAIKAMKVVPLDIAKAMKTLGLPPAQKAALAKALENDEARCTKALDDLSKQAKLGQSGKDMYASLKKAKVV